MGDAAAAARNREAALQDEPSTRASLDQRNSGLRSEGILGEGIRALRCGKRQSQG